MIAALLAAAVTVAPALAVDLITAVKCGKLLDPASGTVIDRALKSLERRPRYSGRRDGGGFGRADRALD